MGFWNSVKRVADNTFTSENMLKVGKVLASVTTGLVKSVPFVINEEYLKNISKTSLSDNERRLVEKAQKANEKARSYHSSVSSLTGRIKKEEEKIEALYKKEAGILENLKDLVMEKNPKLNIENIVEFINNVNHKSFSEEYGNDALLKLKGYFSTIIENKVLAKQSENEIKLLKKDINSDEKKYNDIDNILKPLMEEIRIFGADRIKEYKERNS